MGWGVSWRANGPEGSLTIYRLIGRGTFPRTYKLSPFASRWSKREIVGWIDCIKDGFEGKKRRL
ncbi:helix-turn-helix transcriptional regulator [Novosphingobium profundi]|uniref:helix-turn-helix transcriptional regulator n=1 Tax=Novosphingobium profundi TaxID=1774954 RepID=UPI001CFD39C0|nr:AlpA family phage regulatory protein [Novosphingobium profundi]